MECYGTQLIVIASNFETIEDSRINNINYKLHLDSAITCLLHVYLIDLVIFELASQIVLQIL